MKAMVLCAGYGKRLGELTSETPKPMLPLQDGRPLVEYIIAHLVRHGFHDILINLHYRPEVIREFLGDGSQWGARLTYSFEPEILGTAGGLKNAESFFSGDEPFLVQYGDMVTNEDLTAMMQAHEKKRALATLLVHERAGSNSVLDVAEDGRIERFLERPTEEERKVSNSTLTFSGLSVLSPTMLANIPRGPCDLPRDVYSPCVATEPIFAWKLNNWRCAVDSPERLETAREAVRTGLLSI